MPSRQQRRHALRAPVLHALHRSLAGQAMAIFEELGSERDKANVMCLEATTATRRATVSGCCASLCPTCCQADAHFTNGNANKALVIVNKVPTREHRRRLKCLIRPSSW